MKICINGVTRDMTPEEEAKFLATQDEASPEDYENALSDLGVQFDD